MFFNFKLSIFVGILQVLKFEFLKFRILEILNFHSCGSIVPDLRLLHTNISGRSNIIGLDKQKNSA